MAEERRTIKNTDDLQRAIEEDELQDAHDLAAQGQAKMSVIEYAKYRSRMTGTMVQPQLLFYYIRTGKIKQESCICGRKVIDIRSADEFFAAKEAKDKAR